MLDNDPLWKLRHALAGLALALLASVLLAAFLGAFMADLFGDSYGRRVALYSLLLVYVLAGAVVLFIRVAQHEKRPLSPGRVVLWTASLWVWPLLLSRRPPAPRQP
jgi:MFS family permease